MTAPGLPSPDRRGQIRASLIVSGALVALLTAGLFAWAAPPIAPDSAVRAGATLLAGAAAIIGGGPFALAILALADPGTITPGPASPELLRGGAWVGALERAAVVASLLTGSLEGIALALAVKGLGRYPELRAPAAAERFIIGTFASVLWACGCAGVGALVAS